MALAHAILVSLCERAGSGYELAHRFDRSIGYFWTATDGRVHSTPVTQRGRPDKKVYTGSALTDSSTRDVAVKLRGGIRAEESAIDWLDEVAQALRESP